MHERQMHERACFLTLTYDDAHLPADRSLDKTHWQLFAKRFRYWQGPFRYFHCGEYGEETLRPHLHALIYGHDFFEDRTFLKMSGKHKLYRSEALDELWGHGYVNIGELTQHSATYVARYSMKSLSNPIPTDFTGERLDQDTGELSPYRIHPYATMSLRPGIGEPWIAKYLSDVYPSDTVIADGKKSRPPKFYDKYLEKVDPDLLETIQTERWKTGNMHKHNSTPDRLETRAEIAHIAQKRNNRDFL